MTEALTYSHFLCPVQLQSTISRKINAGSTPIHQKIEQSLRLPRSTNLFSLSNQAHEMVEEQQINALDQVDGKDCIPVASVRHHGHLTTKMDDRNLKRLFNGL